MLRALLLFSLSCVCSGLTSSRHALPSVKGVRRSGRVTPVMMPQGVPQVLYQGAGMDSPQFVDLYQYLYRNRIMMIANFVDEEVANNMIATLLWLKGQDPVDKPITIYFNVAGALMTPGLAVYDCIRDVQTTTDVNTINIGLAVGMAAILCGAGNHRMALPNARYLVQKTGMEDPVSGQASDVALEASQYFRSNNRMTTELARMTGHPVEKIERDLERDFYLDAAEAVHYGLIDKVLLPKRKSKRVETYSDIPDAFGLSASLDDVVGYGLFSDAGKSFKGEPGTWTPPTPKVPGAEYTGQSPGDISSMLLGLNDQLYGADGNPLPKADLNEGPHPDEGKPLIL